MVLIKKMKALDFRPHKSKSDFRKNYKLHDLAEEHGKNLLTQWGVKFRMFGEDKRFERVWEKGLDKPDMIISINDKDFFLDWKSKHKPKWLLNKRAFDSYLNWSKKFSIDVIIVFFLFNKENELIDRKFAVIGIHNTVDSVGKEWDRNRTVEFSDDLPSFTKVELINHLAK